MKQIPSWEADRFSASQEITQFYEIWRFITTLRRDLQLALSGTGSILSMPPHPASWRSILILPSILRLGISSRIFTSGFHTKILYAPLHSIHTCYVPRLSHYSLFDHPNNIWGGGSTGHEAPRRVVCFPLGPRYLPHHPVLEHLQPMFLPHCERPSFTPVYKNKQSYYRISCSFSIADVVPKD